MKATFIVPITKPGGGIRFAHKEAEIDFMPVAGMQIEDTVWKSPSTVKTVSYGIQSMELSVHLEKHETLDENDQDQTVKMYKGHEWNVPF